MKSIVLKPEFDKISRFVIQKVRSVLRDTDCRIFMVGGILRDTKLGIRVSDLDFTVTGNSRDFYKKLRKKLGDTSVYEYSEFKTTVILYKSRKLEFVDAGPGNGKNPKKIPDSLLPDLKRRDFTINALAQEIKTNGFGQVIDLFNGIRDIKNRLINTPVNPDITLKDDPLRILRAFRFSAEFNFEIDPEVYEAIIRNAGLLQNVSFERIRDEISKMISGLWPSRGFALMKTSGVLKYVIPEMEKLVGVEEIKGYRHKDVFEHTLKVLDNTGQETDSPVVRLAALLHDIAKPATKRFSKNAGWTFHGHDDLGSKMAAEILKRLRFSGGTAEKTAKLIALHLRPISLSNEGVTDSAIRRLTVSAGELFSELMILCRADITSGNPQRVKKHLRNFDFVEERVKEVFEKDELAGFRSPVDGNEIMQICGIPPGPKIGKLKSKIEDAILEGIIPNEHDAALEYLLKIKDEVIKG